MRMTNRVLFLLLMLALAVPVVAAPATAFAQSAGDDQYVDPFQDDQTGNGNQNDSNSQGDGTNATPTPDQPTAQAPADTGDTAAANAAGEANSSGTTLPRTGMPPGELALVGVILLAGGFALRRAWPLPD
jgi:hypothetical protein